LRLSRLNERFFAELRTDVARLCDCGRPSDVCAGDHITNWTRPRGEVLQFSLLNTSGRCDDFSDDHDLSCFGKKFHLRGYYSSLALFIDAFPHAVNFRVNVLGPGARLAPHEEHSIIRTRTGAISAREISSSARDQSPRRARARWRGLPPSSGNHSFRESRLCPRHAQRWHPAEHPLGLGPLAHARGVRRNLGDGGGPTWSTRIDGSDRAPPPLRSERIGAYIQLPSPVGRVEAEQLDLCEPQ
jgi:hypothetical protein